MAVGYEVIEQAIVGTGTVNIPVSAEPKAILFLSAIASSAGVVNGLLSATIGGWVGGSTPEQRAVGWRSAGNAATTTLHIARNRSMVVYGPGTSSVVFEATVTGVSSTQITLNVTANLGDYRLVAVCFSGDIETDAGHTAQAVGQQTISTEFDPGADAEDFLLFVWYDTYTTSTTDPVYTGSSANHSLTFGVASGDGTQGCISGRMVDGAADALSKCRTSHSAVAAFIDSAGGLFNSATFDGTVSNGFNLTWSDVDDTGRFFNWLCVKGIRAKVLSGTARTTVDGTGDQTLSPGFTPLGGLALMTEATALDTYTANYRVCVGAFDSDAEASLWLGDTDAVGTTVSGKAWSNTKALLAGAESNSATSIVAEADVSISGSDLVVGWTTVDAVARRYLVLAVGAVVNDTSLQGSNTFEWTGTADLTGGTAPDLQGAGDFEWTGTGTITPYRYWSSVGGVVFGGEAIIHDLNARNQFEFTGVGDLTTSISLIGDGAFEFGASATLTTGIAIQASGAFEWGGTADLTTGATTLEALGQFEWDGIGSLTTAIPLTAQGTFEFGAAATLTTAIPLAGGVAFDFSGVGSLSTAIRFTGGETYEFGGVGSLSTAIPLVATGTFEWGGGGTLSGTSIPLAATALFEFGGTADLTTTIALVATGTFDWGGLANLTTVPSPTIVTAGRVSIAGPHVGRPTLSSGWVGKPEFD